MDRMIQVARSANDFERNKSEDFLGMFIALIFITHSFDEHARAALHSSWLHKECAEKAANDT
jgi:hypothetical protein